ncbi:hypothetical protein GGR27_000173 [Lewinella antarctica]|uniref:Uncharacterized protein n=1 Tax=Neolewinella antarctica TaxID=442734 RepID=A0ABX0X778_9BACT|nr:hypothetical protein [Neolewinella antarctica]
MLGVFVPSIEDKVAVNQRDNEPPGEVQLRKDEESDFKK